MARIGMRNLKTALAVFLSIVISKLLKLEFPFFVAIAAIISMENSLLRSYTAGKNRLIGTGIGAGLGLIGALIQPGSALVCGIGMVGVIYFCNLLKWRKPIQIAGVVFLAVMMSLNGKNPYQYSINRIFDTFIGIAVAVAVNYLVFPPDYFPRIRRRLAELLRITARIIRTLSGDERVEWQEYEKEFAGANEMVELFSEDYRFRWGKNHEDSAAIRRSFAQLNTMRQHLAIIVQLNATSHLNAENARELQAVFGGKEFPRTQTPEGEADVVFNYHVREVIGIYRKLEPGVGVE